MSYEAIVTSLSQELWFWC